MIKTVFFYSLVFIAVSSASNVFAIKNDPVQNPLLTQAESGNSADEESILEEEQELLGKNEQNGNNANPDKMIINPDETKNEVDGGFILGAPEGSENTIDPGIRK